MSKNLYKLECPISSEYNYETPGEGKSRSYIQLLPGITIPKTKIAKNEHGVDQYALYYTNNPRQFWAAPIDATAGTGTSISLHTQAAYETLMGRFTTGYNSRNAEKVSSLFSGDFKSRWKKEFIDELVNEYGEIVSFNYMGLEMDNEYEEVALFKLNCAKSIHCMAISISNDDNSKFGTFRFQTYSNYIDWRLAKELDKERAGK
jgi:hypothetical protein